MDDDTDVDDYAPYLREESRRAAFLDRCCSHPRRVRVALSAETHVIPIVAKPRAMGASAS